MKISAPLILIIVVYLVNSIFYLEDQSVNADEGSFANYAVRYLKGDPARRDPRTDNSKMPVIALNMLPRALGQLIDPGLVKQDEGRSDIMMGRYVSLFFSVFIILIIHRWASRLYGSHAGLFAAFLFCFCPNSLANASFVSTDIYSVLMLLLSLYFFWKWTTSWDFHMFLALSFCVAVSQLVKQSLFHLYVLLPLMVLLKRPPRGVLRLALVFIGIQWLVINMGYYFHQGFQPLGSYRFMSELFKTVEGYLPADLPVPFPKAFVYGLDMAKYYDQVGGGISGVSSFGKVTILGEEATGGSFWYYYLVTLLFKTPIATLLFLIAAVMLKRKWSWNEVVLLAPVLYFLVVFSLFYKTQAGIRHIIFLYPLVFIFISSLLQAGLKGWQRKLLWANAVYLIISVGMYFRDYYPYTNELIASKRNAWKYVGAANLEINQGFLKAERYLRDHPEISFVPKEVRPGKFLVSTEQYLDTWNTGDYKWLHEGKIVGRVGYSWMLVERNGQ